MATATDEFVVRFMAEGARELQQAFRDTSTSASDAGEKLKRTTDSYSKYNSAQNAILEPSRRVKTNIIGLAESFATGASNTDLLKESALRLSEVFRIGLGPVLAVGIGTALYESVRKSRDETEKLRSEITALTSDRGDIRPLKDIESHLDAIRSARQKIYDLEQSKSHLFGLGVQSLLPTPANVFGVGPFSEERKQNEENLAKLQESERRDLEAVAITERTITSIQQQRLSGSQKEADIEEAKVGFMLKQADTFDKFNKPGMGKELNAILDEQAKQYGQQVEKIEDQDKLRKTSNDHARDLARIDEKGLSPLDEKLQKLGLEVKVREKILSQAGSLEEKDKADADLVGAKANRTNAIRNAGLSGMQSPSQFTSELKSTLTSFLRPIDTSLVVGEKRQLASDAASLAAQELHGGNLAESERLNRISDSLKAEANAIEDGQKQLVMDAQQRLSGKLGTTGADPAGKDFSGIGSLSGLDFSGMKMLSGLDFRGLIPLSGLSITIA